MASAADALRLEQEARELRTQLASEQARARSVSVVPPVVAKYLDAPAAVHLAHPETTGCAVPVAFMLCVPVKGTSGAEASYEHWGVLQEEDTTPDCMKALEALMKYVHLHITRDAVLESDLPCPTNKTVSEQARQDAGTPLHRIIRALCGSRIASRRSPSPMPSGAPWGRGVQAGFGHKKATS